MKNLIHLTRPKDPGSALTHFIGMVLAIFAATPLIIKATQESKLHVFSFTIFIVSMILLYGASTVYHTFDISAKINTLLKKCDHMMIFVMIAGSYTPICLIVLKGITGIALFIIIWSMALLGITLKAFWVTCPKWFSSLIYIAMGWTCIFSMSQITAALPDGAFSWLLAGGILYTIGGIIYALKLPIFNNKHKNFGSHEVFHIFVMLGSICHFVMMYCFISCMP